MLQINRYKLKTFLILSLFGFFSCTNGFEEMNQDPLNTNPEMNDPNDGNDVFYKFFYEGMYAQYQRATNLTHDIYAGYFANNNPKSQFVNGSPNYIYSDGWSGYRWSEFYQNRTKEFLDLMKLYTKEDNKAKCLNVYHITRIYYAFLATQMADTYGPIPFSVFIDGGEIPNKLPYDTEEQVYRRCFEILTDAVNNIKIGESLFQFPKEADVCYEGDESKWIRFANTLRLRMALRISNVDPAWAEEEGKAALNATGGLMIDNGDNMRTIPKYAPVEAGGKASGGDENIHALCSYKWKDCCMSKDLEEAYKNQATIIDPRCGKLWWRPTPASELENGNESTEDFRGCEIGDDKNINQESDFYSVLRCREKDLKVLNSDDWFGLARESVWMSYSESLFLRAEAALRGWTGGYNKSVVKDYFDKAVIASITGYYGITRADRYLSVMPGRKAAFDGDDKELMLEQIITQKWIAIFPNGNEGWAEFRRTDYPRLRNHVGHSGSDVPVTKFIKRVRYPNSELEQNIENVPAKYNTSDAQAVRIWWDVEDTNDENGNRKTPNNFR